MGSNVMSVVLILLPQLNPFHFCSIGFGVESGIDKSRVPGLLVGVLTGFVVSSLSDMIYFWRTVLDHIPPADITCFV